jgi:glyoxylase-like metal-dependent hydrolase (beta-lactamase superfamily II)
MSIDVRSLARVSLAALLTLVLPAIVVRSVIAAPEETTITEVAPGVFFRKAQTEPVFTGCNQGFVVFRDFVLIIDANFPGQAENVIASIRERTDKPIKFVFDTHYHGDHADGNMQYVKLGATIVAQERSQPLFQTKGADGFEGAKKSRASEYGELSYEIPSLYFSHKLVFDDGDQRVELLFFGHAHTAGDAVAWLPKHGIVFTGDACVNGAFNYTGDANTESWISVLGAVEDLGVKTVCPGHGEMGGKEVLANQKRWFLELRAQVKAGIDKGQSLEAIKEAFDVPFYKEWTGKESKAQTENIEHVFKELSNPGKPLGLKSRPHRHPQPHPSQPAVGTVGNKR